MFMKRYRERSFTENICRLLLYMGTLVILVFCFSRGISGNDFWWHIKVGEWIVENGRVPTSDIFSWYGIEQSLPWTAHEWLAEVILYAVYAALGGVGVYALSFAAAAAMCALLLSVISDRLDRNPLVSGLYLALFSVLTSLFFYGRPHLFSYFLLFWELKLLYGFVSEGHGNGILWIPLIAVLWSNLHGGSASLCYVLCMLFLAAGVFRVSLHRLEGTPLPRPAVIKLALVTLGAALGTLVNPVGWRVLVYPFQNLSDGLSMTMISEWSPPDAKLIGHLVLYFLPILVTSLGIVISDKRIRLYDLAVMLAFLYLFFRSVRFIILWYIAAAFYAFDYVPPIKVKEIRGRLERSVVAAFILLLLLPLGMGVSSVIETCRQGTVISRVMQTEVIEAVRADAPSRLFNDYNLGEALIYHEIPVFFDARADLYAQDHIMADGVSMMLLEQANADAGVVYADVDALMEKYRFDAVLILKTRPLYTYMRSHPQRFACVYEDASVAYYRITEVETVE